MKKPLTQSAELRKLRRRQARILEIANRLLCEVSGQTPDGRTARRYVEKMGRLLTR